MPKSRFFTIICMSLLLIFVYGCNKGSNESEVAEASTQEHEHGEQAGLEHEQGEHSEEGEEAGPRIAKDGIHDEVRKGVRLILTFDNEFFTYKAARKGNHTEISLHIKKEMEIFYS